MSLAIDIILVLIFLFTVTSSFKKGLILNIYDMVSFVLVIYVAFTFTQPVSEYIMETPMYYQIMENVSDNVKSEFAQKGESNNNLIEKYAQEKGFGGILKSFNIDIESAQQALDDAFRDSADNASKAVYNSILVPISKTIVNVISFILLLLVASLASFILRLLLKFLSKLPVLKGANKSLGGILGILLGIFYVFIAANLISVIIPGLILLGINIPSDCLQNTYILNIFTGVDIFSLFKK